MKINKLYLRKLRGKTASNIMLKRIAQSNDTQVTMYNHARHMFMHGKSYARFEGFKTKRTSVWTVSTTETVEVTL